MPEAKGDVTESALKRKRFYAYLGGAFVALVLLLAVILLPNRLGPNVVLGGQTFKVEAATTPAQQEQGLSGRTSLGDHQGMLFLFQDPQRVCFWMKDMHFDIDILWFDEHQRLVHQERNVSPDTYPKEFCPPKAIKYVLEVPAGTADHLSLKDDADIEVNL
jgi:uncharacterized membrane protein (UPF0127 family)